MRCKNQTTTPPRHPTTLKTEDGNEPGCRQFSKQKLSTYTLTCTARQPSTRTSHLLGLEEVREVLRDSEKRQRGEPPPQELPNEARYGRGLA